MTTILKDANDDVMCVMRTMVRTKKARSGKQRLGSISTDNGVTCMQQGRKQGRDVRGQGVMADDNKRGQEWHDRGERQV
jgi:hypothetical protein